jgi:hypothetical protein
MIVRTSHGEGDDNYRIAMNDPEGNDFDIN